jgi:hypothetical protein
MRWIMGRVLSHVLESFLHVIEDTGASTLLLLSQCLCAQYKKLWTLKRFIQPCLAGVEHKSAVSKAVKVTVAG